MAGGKMGRPRIEWTGEQWKTFEGLCAIQCTKEDIAAVMRVSEDSIERLVKKQYGATFAVTYKKLAAPGRASLRRTQFELAKHNAAMAIFLGKQYLGQKDNPPDVNEDKLLAEIDRRLYGDGDGRS